MNNSMVAHLWAHEQEESANGSNFYFEGESIYSYGRHFEIGRIVRNKRGEKAYLINDTYYSSTTSKHQYYVREAIPTGSKVFYVECNISYCIGNMLFVTNMLESIKDAIEKYKKARTELSYRDVWGNFKNIMDYIEFFDMETPQRLLKKSANEWLGTNHELSWKSDKIKREHVRELKRIFQILLNHQALEVLGTVNVIVDEVCGEGTWIKYSERSERWRKGEEERERIKLERLRKEEEARYKDFDEKLEEWKSGEINFLNTPFYIPGEKPNAWIRIKGNIIETSKQIKIGIAEARNPKLRNLLEDGEYIPSLGQLNLMAHYMDELNKAFTYVSASPLSSTWYWSSTESSQAVAWYVVFSSGLTGTGNKHIGDMVRTVIDF